MAENQATYSCASCQLTLITGRRPRPQPDSAANVRQPPAATHASHWSKVTSCIETANGPAIVTGCKGPSSSERPPSLSGEPIVNAPLGTTTMPGQCGA